MRKVKHTIIQPTGLRSCALLAKSRVDASLALLGVLHEGILLAIRLCLATGAAVVHTADTDTVFVAEVVPVRSAD